MTEVQRRVLEELVRLDGPVGTGLIGQEVWGINFKARTVSQVLRRMHEKGYILWRKEGWVVSQGGREALKAS